MSFRSRNFIQNKYNMNPADLAVKLGYSQVNIDILNYNYNEEELFSREHHYEYNLINDAKHMRDSRTVLEFAKDMINNWLIEDLILDTFSDNELQIYLNGTDCERSFSPKEQVTTQADYVFKYKGYTFTTELVCDYSDCWMRNQTILLRDSKAIRLHEREDLLFAVDLVNDGFFLIDFKYDVPHTYLSSIDCYGGKKGIAIDLTKFIGYELNIDNIKFMLDEIIKYDQEYYK